MDVTCDGCGKDFDNSKIRKKKLGAGVEQLYFDCPHCGRRYLICKTNGETRALQKQISKQRAKVKHLVGTGADYLHEKIKLEQLVKRHMTAMVKLHGQQTAQQFREER